ncbi:putative clathrin assembly protein At2g01600 isoform X1 [Cynara cardunculus var. scolymus]|uniref:putative clathrin assembly protein At2g01600 isoform X1 n=1 Tax=Cynara cardunculus var. scolymus TaxID=59895 RepID=UPI000D63131E|nr:putative clathrin assembly protein At2g01600 isoform X1 [Cynara cardunculus var. scolymus]
MGTMQTWRKAYGALKDQTTVGLAHVNSDFKDVDVAIVKATNHVECPPKERHIRKILAYTSAIRPRADVQYCLHALARRLAKTRNWTVALKTLIVIHRTLREGDPTFREELQNFQQRGRVLQLANFKDDSSPIAWDCSAWVRTYGLFLEERLECFRILKYDIEAERIPRPAAQGQDKGYSRTRDLESEELLEQLPALQQLLYRLMGCRPEGAAVGNYLIQYALALVLKESFKIYCAVNDGIINLIDKFFEMPRHEAIKALDIYKRAGQQAGSLSDFYEVCKGLELARNFQFPVLREPPQSFLATMEEYIREAPRLVAGPTQPLEFPERLMLTYKPEEDTSPHEDTDSPVDEPKPVLTDEFTASNDVPEPAHPPPPPTFNSQDPDDLLGLNFDAPNGSAIEESNALALAIVPSDPTTTSASGFQGKDFDPTGWELALVTTPSANISSVQERQLAGGLDSLTLNSLYDEGAYRASQQPVYGSPAPNPFEAAADPFGMSAQMTPYQANPFGQYQPAAAYPPQPQQNLMMAPPNPFVDSGFGPFPVNNGSHPQTTNPFGTTLL